MFVIGIVNAINISRSTIRKVVHFWCIFGVEAPEGSKVGHRTEYGDDPISVQARDSVEAALQYEMGRGFVTGSKLFFALELRDPLRLASCSYGRSSRTGRRSHGTTAFNMILAQLNRSQSIPCWPFLSRDNRLHLLNFLFQRLRSFL